MIREYGRILCGDSATCISFLRAANGENGNPFPALATAIIKTAKTWRSAASCRLSRPTYLAPLPCRRPCPRRMTKAIP